VLRLFVELSRRTDAATLLVTHDPSAARVADVVVQIEDGWLKTG
jgi:ABC-type lipoprotein export system ATPase subunit